MYTYQCNFCNTAVSISLLGQLHNTPLCLFTEFICIIAKIHFYSYTMHDVYIHTCTCIYFQVPVGRNKKEHASLWFQELAGTEPLDLLINKKKVYTYTCIYMCIHVYTCTCR